MSQLKEEKYDIYVTAAFDGCTYGLFHLLGIPSMVGFTATPGMDGVLGVLFGVPEPPSFVTDIIRCHGSGDKLEFWERAEGFYRALEKWAFPNQPVDEREIFTRVYGEGFPSLREIGSRVGTY